MSANPRMTKQDVALVSGAIRRAFSRSELRRRVVEASVIAHSDSLRPRVKTWCRCVKCKKPSPKSSMEVDHSFQQVIPLDKSLMDVIVSESGWDNLVNRIWCDVSNLQALCGECHQVKTQEENRIRRRNRKGK